jgi:hypothetical protein
VTGVAAGDSSAAAAVSPVDVAGAGALEAALVTAVLDDAAVALDAPIDPVCQTAPKARTKVASRLATARRRILAIRRARSSSRARAVVFVTGSVGCMTRMLRPACERRLRGTWELAQSYRARRR